MTSLPRLRVGLLTPALGLLLAAGAQAQAPRAEQQAPPQQLSAQQAQEAAEQQPPAEPPPGYLLGVEGSAVLERDNTTGDAIPGMPLLIGDRLRSEGGRLEVKWAERSELLLARYTDLDILARGMVRVPRGRVTIKLITAPGQSAGDQLALDAPGASVRFFSAGEYVLTVCGSGEPEVELAVVRGSAQLSSDRGQIMLAEGERSLVKDGGEPVAAGPYAATQQEQPIEQEADEEDAPYDPSPDLEAFQRPSAGGAYGGTQYLPNELYGYETVLNQNGTWMSDPSYGNVWYPRVQSDWRPYYRGRWHHVPRYGWTWVGAERWAWPTHHYGRWGFHQARGFFWIPARKWGPAWVSWAIAPNYVGWCPLGWDGRPVFGFDSFGSTTVIARGYDPWRGWTVVNSGRFGRGYDVRRNRVDHRVLARERPAFVTAWGPPRRAGLGGDVIVRGEGRDGRGVAVPRHGYADPRNVYGSRGTGSGTRGSGSGSRRIGDPGVIVPRDNNAEPEDSPYDRALRVMNRRGNNDRNDSNGGARPREGSSNPGDGAPGRSGDAPSTVTPGGGRTYGNSYGGNGAYPRHGAVTRQPSSGRDRDGDGNGGGDTSPGISRSPAQDDAPGASRPRNYDGGGAVRRYGNGGDSNGTNGNNDSNGGDRGRRSGDSDRGGRRGDSGGNSGGNDSNAGSSRERSAPPPAGVSSPRHGGSSDSGGSSAGRSSDRGDRGGSSAGRSSDGGSRSGGRSDSGGGGGAVRRHR